MIIDMSRDIILHDEVIICNTNRDLITEQLLIFQLRTNIRQFNRLNRKQYNLCVETRR